MLKDIKNKIFISSMLGSALEFYDFALYGFFAPWIAPLFFPATDPMVSTIAAFGVFSLSFFTRPIGGIIFGYLGDRYGRKRALSLSILLMAIPTCAIGLLPTYQQIGVMAPLLLMASRLLQGICAGGEFSGAAIFVLEHTDNNRKGLMGGLLISGCMVGLLLGSGMNAILANYSNIADTWRIPFLLGIIPGVIGFYLRRYVNESPAFEQFKQQKRDKSTPLKSLLQDQPGAFLTLLGISGFACTLFYFGFVGFTSYMPKVTDLTPATCASLATVGMTVYFVFLPIMGAISDRTGYSRLILFSAIIGIAFTYPIFYCALHGGFWGGLVFEVFCGVTVATCMGPFHALTLQLFPVGTRYIGSAMGYGMAQSIFGGTTPMIVMYLLYATQVQMAPAIYITVCALMGFAAIYKRAQQEGPLLKIKQLA